MIFSRKHLLVMTLLMPLYSWGEGEQATNIVANDTAIQKDYESAQANPLPLNELRAFTEIFARIKQNYVSEVSDQELLENAIQGMLSGLDPHSAYLLPQDFKELEESTAGEFGGLGIEVAIEDGFVRVISPIDDTPAYDAGVEAGDLIVRINDEPIKGITLNQSVDKMRGKPGSKVKLTVVRKGLDQPLDIVLERAIIKIDSVKVKILEPGYGYLRISQFQSDTGSEVEDGIKELIEQQSLKGLILDLRNNPGGVLQEAVRVTDAFIDKGLIVSIEGRDSDNIFQYSASEGGIATDVPLVVLINSGSASASEIVAGALQDHRRAVVLGIESFGKGSVQTVVPLYVDDSKGLKLTTAFYFTPSGRSIQAKGIQPDIEVLNNMTVKVSTARKVTKEIDLQGHLESERAQQEANSNRDKDAALNKDYQLQQALNVVKGIHLNQMNLQR